MYAALYQPKLLFEMLKKIVHVAKHDVTTPSHFAQCYSHKKPPPRSYLPHLDGLRALALTGVLLFHFEVSYAKGGFLGVDCFLALSGFLISRNVLFAIRDDSFSFRQFYVNRFWRLYPASFATSAVTVLVAYLVFPPDLALETIHSAISSMLFTSNIHFFQSADYFDGDARLKPLLHTWSLSLEEQFYLFWPFLLYISANKFHLQNWVLPAALLVICAISITVGTYLHPFHPSFVFFLLPCRLYQFGLGAFCALTENKWNPKPSSAVPSRALRAIVDVISLFAAYLVCSTFFTAERGSTPLRVFTVTAATCILIATPTSMTSRYLLGNRLSRFLGVLSYSAYLTHWVVFVFCRYICLSLHVPKVGKTTLMLLTFCTAWVLHKAIENPFRKQQWRLCQPFFRFAVPVFGVCVWGLVTNGWDFRIENSNIGYVSKEYLSSRSMCKEAPNVPLNKYHSQNCSVGVPDGKGSNVVIAGDSFSRHLIPAFDRLGKQYNMSFIFNFMTSCPFLAKEDEFLRKTRMAQPNGSRCLRFHKERWKLIEGKETKGFIAFAANSTFLVANSNKFESIEDRRKRLGQLEADIRSAGHRLVIVGEPPGLKAAELWRFSCLDFRETPLGKILKGMKHRVVKAPCVGEWATPRFGAGQNSKDYQRVMSENLPTVRLVDFYAELCRADEKGHARCRTPCERGGKSARCSELGYTRDARHLTVGGSRFLSGIIAKSLMLSRLGGEPTEHAVK